MNIFITMPKRWKKLLAAVVLRLSKRSHHVLQLAIQHTPEALRAQALTCLPNLNPELLERLLAAGVISPADFKTDDIIGYVQKCNYAGLDSLVAHGADPAAWGPSVLLRASYSHKTTEWFAQHMPILPVLEQMTLHQSRQMRWNNYDSLMQDEETAACLLWFAARHDRRCVLWSQRFGKIRTRANFLAHSGRALRALINKRYRKVWLDKLRWLSASDLASVGLDWSSFI
jgi:hypothetical protein